MPHLKTFVTLSPIPGLTKWIKDEGLEKLVEDPGMLKQITAHYLVEVKGKNRRPIDPVAKFHLGNGAIIHQINIDADLSDKGLLQSKGVMVNYLYDLSKISQNVELFSKEGEISANTTIKSLSRQAGRNIMQKGKAKELSQ